MKVPYDTGRVKIGSNWHPAPQAWTPTRTEAMLQDALLARKGDKPRIDWNGIGITLGCMAGVVAAYGFGWLSI